MPDNEYWLLPEGIEELLPLQAARLEQLRRDLLDLYSAWGYELVVPPFIEYLETLLTGAGNDLDLQTFKLTDQLSGRMMGIRADMTPQVARIHSRYLRGGIPTRLCYMGTVLRTRPAGIAGSRSPLQVGAELYGHAGVASDVEVLQLMVETLAISGIEHVHIDLGHVGIFRGLARQAGLERQQESQLFDALQRKAKPEISALLDGMKLSGSTGPMLLALAELNGGSEVMERAGSVLGSASAEVQAALLNLQEIAEQLRRRIPGICLHFDLAELRGYRYHTGAVFAIYVPGHSQAVAQGGRYDDIGCTAGDARPATGFSTDLKTLITLGATRPEARRDAILAPSDSAPELQKVVEKLRRNGERVINLLPGQPADGTELGCNRQLIEQDGEWKIVTLGK